VRARERQAQQPARRETDTRRLQPRRARWLAKLLCREEKAPTPQTLREEKSGQECEREKVKLQMALQAGKDHGSVPRALAVLAG